MATRLPSLRGIETFVCVAELLNLRLASERLHVTVSAISHRIQTLEQEVGVQLLDRSGRRLRLTPDGEAFLDRLKPGISLLQDATQLARKRNSQPIFRIAAPGLFHDWLVPRISKFHASHPDIRIELLTSGRRRSAAADVSVLPLTPASQRDGAQPLTEIQIAPICSPSFLASHPIRDPHDLLSLPLLDTVPTLRSWQEWFAAAGVKGDLPVPFLSFDNQGLLYKAVAAGLGVALGMRTLVAEQIAQGSLVEPLGIACDFRPDLGILVNESGNVRLGKAFSVWVRAALAAETQISSTPSQKT